MTLLGSGTCKVLINETQFYSLAWGWITTQTQTLHINIPIWPENCAYGSIDLGPTCQTGLGWTDHLGAVFRQNEYPSHEISCALNRPCQTVSAIITYHSSVSGQIGQLMWKFGIQVVFHPPAKYPQESSFFTREAWNFTRSYCFLDSQLLVYLVN